MRVVLVGYSPRIPKRCVCAISKGIFVSGHGIGSNTLITYLDHRRHDWFDFNDHELPSRADVCINIFSSKTPLPKNSPILKSGTVLNPKSSHRFAYDPAELYALLSKIGVDHPKQVSAGYRPAEIRFLGGGRQKVYTVQDEVIQKGSVRIESPYCTTHPVYAGSVLFRLSMMGTTPYFLYAKCTSIRPPEKLSDGLYERIIAHGIRKVKQYWNVFSKIQASTKLTGIIIEFGLRDGDLPCVFALETSMGVPKSVIESLDDAHIRRVRDELTEGEPLSFDMMLPRLRLKKSLILTCCPKTAGSTLKAFFQTHFATYTLHRSKDGDYEVRDRHDKPVAGIESDPFVLLTTHHGVSALVPRFVTQKDFDAALKVVSVRDTWSRIGSIYMGSEFFRRFSFDEFCRRALRIPSPSYRVKPSDYRNMDGASTLININPQADWLDEPHDQLVHMETLKEDVKRIMSEITDDHYDLAWLDRVRRNVRDPYSIVMNRKSRNLVNEFYKRDTDYNL